MSVDRLQGLLERVQHNRARPHAPASAAVAAPVAAPAAAPAPAPSRERPDATLEFGTPLRAAPAPAPTREPVRESVTMPGHASPAPRRQSPTPMEMAVEHAQPAPAQPARGQVIAAPSPVQPSRPIAEVAAPHQPASFFALLARSLGLRPR